MSEWLRRTNTGRVVYLRPKHSFVYRDAARILRSLLDEEDVDDRPNVIFPLWWAVENFKARIQDWGFDIADKITDRIRELPQELTILRKLSQAIVETARAYRSLHGITGFRGAKGIFFPTIITQSGEVLAFGGQLGGSEEGDPWTDDIRSSVEILISYLQEVGQWPRQ